MNYEVELKFPVAQMADLESRLAAMGVAIAAPHEEVDLYLAHPSRDFVTTDEALRLRRKGGQNLITYKGPKIDTTTKTRHEIELPLAPGDDSHAHWAEMLALLGFRRVAEVRKSRRKAMVAWEGREIEMSLDEVEGVGTYAELELVVPPSDLEAAKALLHALAGHLGLHDSERRSYLEMLLTQEKGQTKS